MTSLNPMVVAEKSWAARLAGLSAMGSSCSTVCPAPHCMQNVGYSTAALAFTLTDPTAVLNPAWMRWVEWESP